MKNYIQIHKKDNCIVALTEIAAGSRIVPGRAESDLPPGENSAGAKEINSRSGENPAEAKESTCAVTALETIPAGHKMAIRDIPAGGECIKYGAGIGLAKEDIKAGAWVHTHNLRTALGEILDYTYNPVDTEIPPTEERTFMGFVREDGSVGVRNEIWIVPTVGCVNSVAQAMAREANERLAARRADGSSSSTENEQISRRQAVTTVSEVIAFAHPYGCSQMGEDQENTRKILSDLIKHPNAGGVLVLGLGCENSGIDTIKPYLGEVNDKRVKFLVCQEAEDEMEEAARLIDELIDYASGFDREPVSASRLIIGMKCGGSDGFSGITANPLVGRFSDMLVSKGGTTILTEVPEMFGAETLLMDRCADRQLFDRTVCLINDFKQYFTDNHQTIYENPSPGNKAGGITTLEDKSLGCTQKSGSSAVRGVLAYGERVTAAGLNLLSAPGNDLVAATALAASGAQIVLFTTGRGTPFACPVPTLKIASNSRLASRKNHWIDFNAGTLAEETSGENAAGESLTDNAAASAALSPADKLDREFFEYVLRIASGEKTASERAGFHDMAIFKQGVTL